MKYESKQHTAYAPAAMIYERLSNFENLTPIVADKVEGWTATADTCAFKVQGFMLCLKMERVEQSTEGSYTIKVVGDETPLPFAFFLQLKEVEAAQTRLRVVADVELNMMFKMMIGGKLQDAVDKLAEQIAMAVNQANSQFTIHNS